MRLEPSRRPAPGSPSMTASDETEPLRRRRLGSFERAQALSAEHFPHNLVICLKLEPAPAPERMRDALDALQRRHPLLRARLVGTGSGLSFELVDAPRLPLVAGPRTGENGWRRVVEAELLEGFDAVRGPLARASVLMPAADGGPGDLILTFHHLIVDGVGVVELLGELLGLCAESYEAVDPGRSLESTAPGARGATGEVTRAGDGGQPRGVTAVDRLPPAPDDLYPPPHRAPRPGPLRLAAAGFAKLRRVPATAAFLAHQLPQEIALRRARSHRPRAASPPIRNRALSLEIPAETSRAALTAARRRRVTPIGLFQAAALLAVVRRRYPDTKLTHAYFVFPLLRPYLDPPVPPGTLGGYLCVMRLTETVTSSDSLWELAGRITHSIHRASKRGDKFVASLWSPRMITRAFAADARMGTSAVSYTGPFQLPGVDPRSAGIRSLGAFVTNPPIGPEFTAQVRLFEGRLRWDAVTLTSDMDETEARALLEDVELLLVEAASSR